MLTVWLDICLKCGNVMSLAKTSLGLNHRGLTMAFLCGLCMDCTSGSGVKVKFVHEPKQLDQVIFRGHISSQEFLKYNLINLIIFELWVMLRQGCGMIEACQPNLYLILDLAQWALCINYNTTNIQISEASDSYSCMLLSNVSFPFISPYSQPTEAQPFFIFWMAS